MPILNVLGPVTPAEIAKIIAQSSAIHFDPTSTWLVKQLSSSLAQTIANRCNASFMQGISPASKKHALIKPRLKKPNLDQEDLNSYGPIFNIVSYQRRLNMGSLFVSTNTVKRTVYCLSVNQLTEHTIELKLWSPSFTRTS